MQQTRVSKHINQKWIKEKNRTIIATQLETSMPPFTTKELWHKTTEDRTSSISSKVTELIQQQKTSHAFQMPMNIHHDSPHPRP